MLFEEIPSSRTGVNFSNILRSDSELNIFNYLYYYNGAGVAAGDYNNDGLPDLYFVSNQQSDRLYLNLGDFEFKDVSAMIGFDNSDGWSTGISNVDINGDGLLDIYISKVSGFLNLQGHNLLLVNQGNSEEGIPVFKEESAKYGLDFSGFSTQAVFLDYDLDGDIDMFLLNHSIHPNRTYGSGEKRKGFHPLSGDRFFKNENGKFIDVSSEAGIFQGEIGYGLGVSVSDLNNDGYPDIYVGNDFFENDYLYINQQNGTYRDLISNEEHKLGHTSHFSMGNDIADINNDGLFDIISVDMLPEDLVTYKTSGLEYPYQTYQGYLKNGFSPQYMQNTLHINSGDLKFSETAYLSGIAATEWSWGPLFADFDNDGFKDLIISNGIKGATNDMDFIRFISNDKIQKRLSRGEVADYGKLVNELPQKKVPNYIFQNRGDNTFRDMSKSWVDFKASFSQGVVYVDLDRDGDLDFVLNNMEDKAGIFRNNAEKQKDPGKFLKIGFRGDAQNKIGIGAKVNIYYNGKMQVQEHYLARGYLSSLEPGLHFGIGKGSILDSVQVQWPNLKSETRYNVKANSSLLFDVEDATVAFFENSNTAPGFLEKVEGLLDHSHVEQQTLDFNRDPLIPFAYSNPGPGISIGDIDGDGLDDLAIGGGKTQELSYWFQNNDGSFTPGPSEVFERDAISEDVAQVFVDVNLDGRQDIIVVSGGNEFKSGKPIQPRLYLNKNGEYELDSRQFQGLFINASGISVADVNKDGFPDVCFISNVVPGKYGLLPKQYIYLNDGKGNFYDAGKDFAGTFQSAGNVQDMVWEDINNDGIPDAIVVGHWMPLRIYLNDGRKLRFLETNLENTNGWWNVVKAGDFDKDGDLDIIAGNWGLNSRLTASKEKPLNLYLNDFDDNGTVDPVVTYFYRDKETAFASKDELDQQLPFLKKKFPNYRDYAKAEFSQLLPKEKIKGADKRQVFELASYYFENLGNNQFAKHILPIEAQVSSIHAIEKHDFNGDGFEDLLLAGNNYEISTQLGRLDASHGTVLLNDRKGFFEVYKGKMPDIYGPVRNIEKIQINGETHFLITRNDSKILVLKHNNL